MTTVLNAMARSSKANGGHPLIAVIGHPNEGKSSVLSTLTEDDSVVVNDYPGETTHCQYFPVNLAGETVLELVDTPGFQNPQRILDWMRDSGKTDDELLRACLDTFGNDPVFNHDCQLLQPLADGAAVIYVVDCSRPLLAVDQAEMEILRLVNKPRMAVINFKDNDRDYLPDWEQAFRRHFNVIREFNAHQARFPERLALLETLKAIQQSWEPQLNKAIAAFEHNWQQRRQQVAEQILDYLEFALQLTIEQKVSASGSSASGSGGSGSGGLGGLLGGTSQAQKASNEQATEQALGRYQKAIAEREQSLFGSIRQLYLHNHFNLTLPAQSVLHQDLFAETTWEVLGLTRKQVLLAAAGMGAGVGVTLEAAVGGLSAGLFATAGALIGGGSAWFLGAELTRVKIKAIPLGGARVTVGPSKNPQFPVVLLDRALLFYREIASHSHGNRTDTVADAGNQSVLRDVASEQQRQLLKLANTLAEGKATDKDREALASLILNWLEQLV